MTTEYPKINGVFKRHLDGPAKGRFMFGAWAMEEFDLLRDVPWHWSEKIDGTNIRITYDPHGTPEILPLTDEERYRGYPLAKFGLGTPSITIQGRTDKAQLHPDLVRAIEDMIDLDLWTTTFEDRIAVVYGEGYGAGIQGVGKLYRPDKSFIGFDVAVGGGTWHTPLRWLRPVDADDVLRQLDLPIVRRYSHQLTLHQALREFQHGSARQAFPSDHHPDAFEGVIGRPALGLLTRFGGRIQTKLKVVDFRG